MSGSGGENGNNGNDGWFSKIAKAVVLGGSVVAGVAAAAAALKASNDDQLTIGTSHGRSSSEDSMRGVAESWNPNKTGDVINDEHWIPPQYPFRKLNTDGSSKRSPSRAGAGGVIRDHDGKWISGFVTGLGIIGTDDDDDVDGTSAEWRGLRDGLELAVKLKIEYLEIELDAATVVYVLKNPRWKESLITSECRQFLSKFKEWKAKHISRKANGCADALAKEGSSRLKGPPQIFDSPPPFVRKSLEVDAENSSWSTRRAGASGRSSGFQPFLLGSSFGTSHSSDLANW